jgi:formamidopyrimidine-DNA glycosylase
LEAEQRIPGLGNGVLQDILFLARIAPRKKLQTMSDSELFALFQSVKSTLADMTQKGGRNTEKDMFGSEGGYQTLLSAKTYKNPCPVCGGPITREAYMGGNVYYCAVCQSE